MPICRLAYADFKMAYADTFIGCFAVGGLLTKKSGKGVVPLSLLVRCGMDDVSGQRLQRCEVGQLGVDDVNGHA